MQQAVTECEVCLGVARGGRIRLTEEGALVNERALALMRATLLRGRRAALDNPETTPFDVGELNLQIRQIDVLLEEIARTQAEKGWRTSHGEPERPHP